MSQTDSGKKRRIVVALGGNALLKRGEPMTIEAQRGNVRKATQDLAPLALEHELVISHGNGPQVGLLALQAAAYEDVPAYPLDVLGAQTEGMIGYLIEQEIGNLLPYEKPIVTVLTMVEVDPNDPAFDNPTKFVGPVYEEAVAKQLARERGWTVKPDGDKWRRVVPSPQPKQIFSVEAIRWLVDKGAVVICTGGGGIPTMYRDESYHPHTDRILEGVEAVIDKDRASALLAIQLDAELFVMATDAEGVYLNWRTPEQRLLRRTTPSELAQYEFAAGSMGPKVEAACRFVNETGHTAAIGQLHDIQRIVDGEAGTLIEPDA